MKKFRRNSTRMILIEDVNYPMKKVESRRTTKKDSENTCLEGDTGLNVENENQVHIQEFS
jgi:hypothetical protein